MTALLGPVRWWAQVYTSGLDPATRDRRRAEIEADVWEQADALTTAGASPSAVRWAVWIRWLLGVPDDLAWRIEQRRNGRTDTPAATRRASSMNLNAARSDLLLAAIVGAAILVVAATTVIGNIQHFEQSQRFLPSATLEAVTISMLVLGLAVIPVGFAVMRARPTTGAILAAGGSFVAALTVYWLIVPLVVALVISAVAIRRARRLARLGA